MNRTVSMLLSAILAMVFIVGMACVILRFGAEEKRTPVGTYEHYGMTFQRYDDPLPLEIESLMEVEGNWSKEAQRDETWILSKTEYHQRAIQSNAADLPDLKYTVVDIHVPFLYEFCKNSWLADYQDEILSDAGGVFVDSYHPIDASPWDAVEVYQHHWSNHVLNEYLICWQGRIVELHFFWEPTPEQISIAAKQLKPN